MDGLDLALCSISINKGRYEYTIIKTSTLPYPKKIQTLLQNAYNADAHTLIKGDLQYGTFLGKCAAEFLNGEKADFISSHGHTVFHNPDAGYTFQLGNGRAIAEASKCDVICDFRTADVLKGGQGAPLVPVGDKLLFSQFNACMNLGGYSNISIRREGLQPAFDIMPCNVILNALANKAGLTYDAGGKTAQSGSIIPELYNRLSTIEINPAPGKKSLSTEWTQKVFLPVLTSFETSSPADLLHTVTRVMAEKTAVVLNREVPEGKLLITGGGAKNKYFISLLSNLSKAEIQIPDEQLIDFKEALIFAFLGVLRITGKNNVLAEATGVNQSHCAGEVFEI